MSRGVEAAPATRGARIDRANNDGAVPSAGANGSAVTQGWNSWTSRNGMQTDMLNLQGGLERENRNNYSESNAMKELWIIAAVGLAASVATAESLTIQRNPFIEGGSDITARDGRTVGVVQDNPFIPGRKDVYGLDGHPEATVRENPFIDGRSDVESDDR